jgi:glycosyltransferase involved in cell wall biosynthesis
MKLACVVQRYGPEVTGGSEAHCRAIAERLSRHHDVTVLTTTARDYLTWKNEYPAGQTTVGSVRVHRFAVAGTRRMQRFFEINDRVLYGRPSLEDQETWFRENGPDAPALLGHLRAHGREYDRVLFWSYRYAPTFCGVPLVPDRAIVVPTAEDDPIAGLEVLDRFFRLPRGYLFLTEEESDLIARHLDGHLPPHQIIGTGIDEPEETVRLKADTARTDATAMFDPTVAEPFILYLGRIEKNKGCDVLFRHFLEYADTGGRPAPLVLAGPAFMRIPQHPLVRHLGLVSDAAKESLLGRASCLVMPSLYESLSIVLLEAWNQATPALVNGRCRVLKGQVERANGGLYYRHFDEFAAALDRLLGDESLARALGQQGRAYVDREYRWPVVMQKVEALLGRT